MVFIAAIESKLRPKRNEMNGDPPLSILKAQLNLDDGWCELLVRLWRDRGDSPAGGITVHTFEKMSGTSSKY